MSMLDMLGNGESYQNYPRLGQTDYRARYWAELFPHLLTVKQRYDPDNTFRYAQSVSPEPGKAWPALQPGRSNRDRALEPATDQEVLGQS